MSYKRIQCEACTVRYDNATATKVACRPSPYCHECKGLGFIEVRTYHPDCKRDMNCPMMESEAMTGGWICYYCGESGPG